MAKKRKVTTHQEDYLEAIHRIEQQKGAARPKDIAALLDVSFSTVTGAMQALAKKSLINYAPFEVITLTESGKTIAQRIIKSHRTLHDFFVEILAIDEEEAEEAACRMEHAVSPKILSRLVEFVDYIHACPEGRKRFADVVRKNQKSSEK